jgi:F-type H+-transporting ATPase subunit epsilon
MLKIKITSPTGLVYEGEAAHVTFPGTIGQFEVFPKHASLISSLAEGDILCFGVAKEGEAEAEPQKFAVKGGFVEVKADNLNVCVETA